MMQGKCNTNKINLWKNCPPGYVCVRKVLCMIVIAFNWSKFCTNIEKCAKCAMWKIRGQRQFQELRKSSSLSIVQSHRGDWILQIPRFSKISCQCLQWFSKIAGFCGSFELKAGDLAQDLFQSQILRAQSLRVLTSAKICHVHSRTLHFSEHLDHQVFPDVSTDFMSCRWNIIKCFLIKKVHDLSKMEASFKILSFWAKGCATVQTNCHSSIFASRL